MKNYLLSLTFIALLTSNANAQTAVEKLTVSNASTLLDFPSGTSKGLILPATESLPTSPANGTFLFDRNDKKVKMFQNGTWINLSEAGDISTLKPYSGTVDNGKRSIIGSKTSTSDGILVLESTDKALVLPKIASPHLTVKSPYPGMMCYDTDKKSVAVFNGTVWSYWN